MDYRSLLHGCLLLLCLTALQADAAVYKWTDENGRVHFSDRPVHEAAEEKKIRATPKGASSQGLPQDRKERRQRMLDVYERERGEKKEAAAKAKEARKERKRKCLNARARYDEYNSAGGIYDYLESGERKFLDKAERQRFMAGLKADITRYCE
ncbi:MAG: DUF4124 domain-containing protein [Candidatus Thiodiazotropha sp. (ex Myrtea sp. 'scaly one' KF741663)]|nr:DUF4124 domain-containing protein [Candidatus Thiodiazotropha sp. (ex Myrtea sp. 'scaly one' KF741663)]